MNKRGADRLFKLMHNWRNLLGMGGWMLDLQIYERTDLPPEVHAGHIGLLKAEGRQASAIIHVAEFAANGTPAGTVIHELVHLVLTDMRITLLQATAELGTAGQAINQRYDDAEERAVNRITTALIKLDERE